MLRIINTLLHVDSCDVIKDIHTSEVGEAKIASIQKFLEDNDIAGVDFSGSKSFVSTLSLNGQEHVIAIFSFAENDINTKFNIDLDNGLKVHHVELVSCIADSCIFENGILSHILISGVFPFVVDNDDKDSDELIWSGFNGELWCQHIEKEAKTEIYYSVGTANYFTDRLLIYYINKRYSEVLPFQYKRDFTYKEILSMSEEELKAYCDIEDMLRFEGVSLPSMSSFSIGDLTPQQIMEQYGFSDFYKCNEAVIDRFNIMRGLKE